MIASKLENNVKIRLLEVIGIMSFSIGIIRDDFFSLKCTYLYLAICSLDSAFFGTRYNS